MRFARLVPASLRGAALLPAAALAVHQLRYALAHGDGAGQALAAEGHAYLSGIAPWLVLLATLSLGASLGRLARRWAAGGTPAARTRATARVWLLATVALVTIYAGQELLEGALAPGHAAGLAGAFGDGGWWALPAALAVAGLFALALRGADAVAADLAGLTLRIALRPPRALSHRPRAPFLVALAPLARAAAGRAPPHGCVVPPPA